MNDFTTHFYGDFHIHITPDSACKLMKCMDKQENDTSKPELVTPSKDYQALLRCMEDYLNDTAVENCLYCYGAGDEDMDSIVMVLSPGEAPKVMTESECFESVERHGCFCSTLTIQAPDICAYGLKAVYDPHTLLPVGSECYIIGPVILYANDENGDSISLDAQEVMAAIVYFAGRMVTLCADGADLPAFRM